MDSRHRAHEARVSLLTRGSMTKGIFSLALPIIGANTLAVAMEISNAFFLGKLGSDALAAITMSGAIVFFLMTFGSGLSIGTVAMVSRACGERNYPKAEHIGAQSLILGIAVAAVIGAAGFVFCGDMLSLLGARGAVLEMGTTYLKFLFAGLFLVFFFFQGNAVFQGSGDTLTPMKIGALSMVINIALSPVFIFGLLGMPRMGIAGAAISTLIARGVGSLVMARIILRGKHAVRMTRELLVIDLPVMGRLFTVGFPGAVQMMVRSTSVLVLTRIAATFEPVVLAALGVGNSIFSAFLLPGFGFGAAASTIVGQNLGARKPARAERGSLMTVGYYWALIVPIAIPLFIFAPHVSTLFNREPAFIDLNSHFIRFQCIAALFLCPGLIFSNALQGAGATVTPMLVVIVTLYGVQLPLTWFLAVHLNLHAQGIWWANLVAGIVNAALMSAMFFRGSWKRKKI
jgi:putative MATE family efflux protein